MIDKSPASGREGQHTINTSYHVSIRDTGFAKYYVLFLRHEPRHKEKKSDSLVGYPSDQGNLVFSDNGSVCVGYILTPYTISSDSVSIYF